MKNMQCKNCALKHIAAAISYGKETMNGHGKGAELDHRPDFLGELVNAEHHLKLLDAKLHMLVTNARRKLQEKDHIPGMSDIEQLRSIWLMLDGTVETVSSKPCRSCKSVRRTADVMLQTPVANAPFGSMGNTTEVDIIDGGPLPETPIVAITCTGDRPEQFAICLKLMEKQIVKSKVWVIVDDGKKPLNKSILPEYARYIRRAPKSDDPVHTLVPNLKLALRHIRNDMHVVFIEDDDFYPDDWLVRASNALFNVDLAGCDARYYQLSENHWKQMTEVKSVLANTALTGQGLRTLRKVIANNNAWDVDMRLWKTFTGSKDNKILEVEGKLHPVGLKMWKTGRPGQTKSWKPREDFFNDPDRTKLKEWVADDIAFYI